MGWGECVKGDDRRGTNVSGLRNMVNHPAREA